MATKRSFRDVEESDLPPPPPGYHWDKLHEQWRPDGVLSKEEIIEAATEVRPESEAVSYPPLEPRRVICTHVASDPRICRWCVHDFIRLSGAKTGGACGHHDRARFALQAAGITKGRLARYLGGLKPPVCTADIPFNPAYPRPPFIEMRKARKER